MSNRNGSALVVAVLALAVAGAVAAALAEIARLTVTHARLQHHATRAWFLAEAGLAETVAKIAPGRSFSADLAATGAGMRSEGDVWSYTSRLIDDADDTDERIIVRIEAHGPQPIRRRLEAVLGREIEPFLPAAATIEGGVRELARDFLLDGRDFDMASGCSATGTERTRAGLALPREGTLPPLGPDQVVGRGVLRGSVPDLRPVADDPRGTRRAPGALTGPLGTAAAPRFTVIEGDAVLNEPVTGVGMLYVRGRLSVRSSLDFTGVLAAEDGIDVSGGAALTVCGAVWTRGEPALAIRGAGAIRRSADAIALAGRLAPLPARAKVIAARELFGGIHG